MNNNKIKNRYFDSKISEIPQSLKDRMASACTLRIQEILKIREGIEPEYIKRKARIDTLMEEFKDLKAEYEKYDTELDELEIAVTTLSKGGKKPLNAPASLTGNKLAKNKKGKLPPIKWMVVIAELLTKAGHPMSFVQIWDALTKDVTLAHKLLERETTLIKNKANIRNSLEIHASSADTRKLGKQYVINGHTAGTYIPAS